MLTLPHLPYIRTSIDPRLAETFERLLTEINGVHVQNGNAEIGPPPKIASLSVTAANGFFTVTINDPAGQAQPNLGIHYFIDWDISAAFSNPTTEDVGPARGEYLYLGNITAFFRAYSQFRNSNRPSPFVYFGGATPTGVNGGGTVSGGTPPGGGSGAGGGGGGFGGRNKIANRA